MPVAAADTPLPSALACLPPFTQAWAYGSSVFPQPHLHPRPSEAPRTAQLDVIVAVADAAAWHAANAAANPESALAPAVPRPYGAWYRTHVGTPWDRVRVATFRAIFVAHRDDIRRRPRSYYANLLHTVSGSSNPEAGHYIERSWPAIFGVTGE